MFCDDDYVPVRLCDVDPEVLRNAVGGLLQHERSAEGIQDLLTAALNPSDDLHWLPRRAVERARQTGLIR